MLDKISKAGWIAGIATWCLTQYLAIDGAACLRYNFENCGGDDMFLHGILAIGSLCPAYFVAFIFSPALRKIGSNDDDN